MTANQLMWIKQRQKEYFQLFGEKLNVDFSDSLVCNKTETVKEVFEDLKFKYNPDMNVINNKNIRLNHGNRENERNFVIEFSKKVVSCRLNIAEAARLLNKDRSNIYHYAGKRKI
jgi:hypothetical protein